MLQLACHFLPWLAPAHQPSLPLPLLLLLPRNLPTPASLPQPVWLPNAYPSPSQLHFLATHDCNPSAPPTPTPTPTRPPRKQVDGEMRVLLQNLKDLVEAERAAKLGKKGKKKKGKKKVGAADGLMSQDGQGSAGPVGGGVEEAGVGGRARLTLTCRFVCLCCKPRRARRRARRTRRRARRRRTPR